MFTVVLLVFVFTLLIGHLLLYLAKPKALQKTLRLADTIKLPSLKLPDFMGSEKASTNEHKPLLIPQTYKGSSFDSKLEEQVIALQGSYLALSQKLQMEHKRLGEVEKNLEGTLAMSVSKGEKTEVISKKLETLDEFRSKTQAEIQTIRQILTELQKKPKSAGGLDSYKEEITQVNKEIKELEKNLRKFTESVSK